MSCEYHIHCINHSRFENNLDFPGVKIYPCPEMSNSLWLTPRRPLPAERLTGEKTGLYFPTRSWAGWRSRSKNSTATLPTASSRRSFGPSTPAHRQGSLTSTQLVAAIATNETYFFFRTPVPFRYAVRTIAHPRDRLREESRGEKRSVIWSAGCSTGEDPYSLAILLFDTFRACCCRGDRNTSPRISTIEALQSAERGIYRPWSFRGVGLSWPRVLAPGQDESRRVEDRVRSLVKFRPLNLESDPIPRRRMARKIWISSRPQTSRLLVASIRSKKNPESISPMLNEGGFLVRGAGEYSQEAYQDFEARVFPEHRHLSKPLPKATVRTNPLSSRLGPPPPAAPITSNLRKSKSITPPLWSTGPTIRWPGPSIDISRRIGPGPCIARRPGGKETRGTPASAFSGQIAD